MIFLRGIYPYACPIIEWRPIFLSWTVVFLKTRWFIFLRVLHRCLSVMSVVLCRFTCCREQTFLTIILFDYSRPTCMLNRHYTNFTFLWSSPYADLLLLCNNSNNDNNNVLHCNAYCSHRFLFFSCFLQFNFSISG